jgi:hypothetical protein
MMFLVHIRGNMRLYALSELRTHGPNFQAAKAVHALDLTVTLIGRIPITVLEFHVQISGRYENYISGLTCCINDYFRIIYY